MNTDLFERYTIIMFVSSIFLSAFYFLLAINYFLCFRIFKFLFATWILEFIAWAVLYLNYRINENEN
jgi:hypothetical protein